MASLSEKFSVTFDMIAETLSILDETTGRTANTKAVVKVVFSTTGETLYKHNDFDELPPLWVSPDFDGGVPTWSLDDIDMPTDPIGDYIFTVKYADGSDTATVVRAFSFGYAAPEPAIDLQVLCSSSELVFTDSTDMDVVIGGVSIPPTTIYRTKSLTKPAGSGCTISPLSWTDSGGTPSVTIGGGSTPGTRIWTRTWQAMVDTDLVYKIATWSQDDPTVYVTDTIVGQDEIFAQCDATICALAQCYANLFDRWQAAITSNFQYREDNRDKIILAQGLFAKLQWYERCGTDTQAVIEALQTLLSGENCNCNTNTDEASVQIVPWAAMTGGGSGTVVSTFEFYIETSDPQTADGANGDKWLNNTTWDLFEKAGGLWSLKGNIKGADGDDAPPTPANSATIQILNDKTVYATGANRSLTTISFEFPLGNSQFTWDNDLMEFEWEGKLGHNANGKTITLDYGGTDVLTYFCDDLVSEETERFFVKMKVVPVNPLLQNLYITLIRGGYPGDVIGPIALMNVAKDLNTPITVRLQGLNSVASASDIVCDLMTVRVWHTDQTIQAGTYPMSVGRGLVAQRFVATEGQTEFTVTDFVLNDYYIPLIDDAPQSQLVVVRSGQVVTYAPGLTAGQVLLIVD